jgi:hypothetical protein
MPATREIALPALSRLPERKQGNDIPRIRVKDLLLRRVRRRADAPRVDLGGQVLDVREDDVGGLAIVLRVLARAERRDVRGQTGVDDDVLLARVLVHGDAADDLEAVAVVDVARDGAQGGVEVGEGEGLLGDLAEGLVQT